MISLAQHPERTIIRLQELRQNVMLKKMSEAERDELAQLLSIVDCAKGEHLLHQGVHDMEQYFLLEGILKCAWSPTPMPRK